MVMTFAGALREEHGFTLLETVVALAIFTAVLLPLCVSVGNLVLDNSAKQRSEALHLAQSELAKVIAERDFADKISNAEREMIIHRHVERTGRLIDVTVSV